MSVNWMNPYADTDGRWLKGNLHTHTKTSACGKMPLADVLAVYEDARFDFLAVTDHNVHVDTSSAASSLSLLQGIEIDSKGCDHMGVISTAAPFYDASFAQQEVIDRNASLGNLVVLHHPDWQINEHYPMQKLLSLQHYDGIEIYNQVIEFLDGCAVSTAKWDRLLKQGRRVLGFCNHDFHDRPHLTTAANIVRAKSSSSADILSSLKSGNFYCRRGVTISDIGRTGNTISVRTENAHMIRFIGSGGTVLKKVRAPEASIDITEKMIYVRAECLGDADEIAWSQPFFFL